MYVVSNEETSFTGISDIISVQLENSRDKRIRSSVKSIDNRTFGISRIFNRQSYDVPSTDEKKHPTSRNVLSFYGLCKLVMKLMNTMHYV